MAKLYGEKKWKRGEQVGEGGQAKAYLATREEDPSGRFVLKEFRNKPKSLKRARAEVLAASKLSHPNLVQLVDFELEHDPPFIVTVIDP